MYYIIITLPAGSIKGCRTAGAFRIAANNLLITTGWNLSESHKKLSLPGIRGDDTIFHPMAWNDIRE